MELEDEGETSFLMQKAVFQARSQEPRVPRLLFRKPAAGEPQRYHASSSSEKRGHAVATRSRRKREDNDSEDDMLMKPSPQPQRAMSSPRRQDRASISVEVPVASTSKLPDRMDNKPTGNSKKKQPAAKRVAGPSRSLQSVEVDMPMQKKKVPRSDSTRVLPSSQTPPATAAYPSPSSPLARPPTKQRGSTNQAAPEPAATVQSSDRPHRPAPIQPPRQLVKTKQGQRPSGRVTPVQTETIENAAAPPPASKRPKFEEPDFELLPAPPVQPGSARLQAVLPVQAERETETTPLAQFLTHTCQPGLKGTVLTTVSDIIASLGVSSQDELSVLATMSREAGEFWFSQAREKGLSMLWESVVRDGLDRLRRELEND